MRNTISGHAPVIKVPTTKAVPDDENKADVQLPF